MASREHASLILMCSTECFRMYNSLCSEEREVESVKSKSKAAFSSRTPALFLAAALAMIDSDEKPIEAKKDKQLTRRDYVINHNCFPPFSQLIKSKYNIRTEQEVIDKLLELQERGIRDLYDEYHKTGKIDFLRIYREAKTRI